MQQKAEYEYVADIHMHAKLHANFTNILISY
jgi:hypothetical protein